MLYQKAKCTCTPCGQCNCNGSVKYKKWLEAFVFCRDKKCQPFTKPSTHLQRASLAWVLFSCSQSVCFWQGKRPSGQLWPICLISLEKDGKMSHLLWQILKLARHRQRSFFWTLSWSIKRHAAILSEQAWSIKDLLFGKRTLFSYDTQWVVTSGKIALSNMLRGVSILSSAGQMIKLLTSQIDLHVQP